jgi:carboxypeptidase Taq
LNAKLDELKRRLIEVNDLNSAGSVLYWDMTTYMPPGGQAARGRQLAMINQMTQEKFIDPEIGKLLDDLRSYGESLPYDHDDAALIRLTRRNYDLAIKVPPAWVAKVSQHQSETYELWTRARPANDFNMVSDHLKKTLDFSREFANFYAPYEHIANPLIDQADYGMKADTVRAIFAELREKLVPIVKAITSQKRADDSSLRRHFPEAGQLAFGESIIKEYGYDFQRGRQDKTHHPYMIRFSAGDIRITTRFNENYLGDGLFSTLHEAGHAMYEQGINAEFDGLPLAGGTSAGVHESQSRTWENIVGRSRPFWEHYYSRLQETFPDQLKDVPLDAFYRAINIVEPSLIRTDADEVTYNLHVMIRFDLELALLEGTLSIDDLPEAWDARYTSDLGITPPDMKDGVLQDVHWYGGVIGGAFQGYTLGNLLSAQFYDAALKAHPEIPAQIGQGNFATLHGWLKDNIYSHGSKFTAPELIERVTGGGIKVEPLINYLRTKYGELYSL